MQALIADCQITSIVYRSPRTTIYSGVRQSDARPVVVKALTDAYPQPRDLARLRLEFRVARRLKGPGVIDVLALEPWGNNLALVEEHFDGAPLTPTPVAGDLKVFFTVALAVTEALARVHEQVIHGDVTPSNILWSPRQQSVRLIDFGAASEIRSEHHGLSADALSDSSLPYMAPERSGRVNRDLDHRTDLYSLGATLYELLTGGKPFSAKDRSEWIYCHVTRQPRAPHESRPSIPPTLSALIVRLLAKDPEDRYQSARGLCADLQECQRRWNETGRIDAFPLCAQDNDGHLRAVQRLCGRETEMQSLFSAFEAAKGGASRAVLVSGEPGVGKTILVNEIRRTIFQLGGSFIEGKFDQFQRHAPHKAIADAFQQLVTQMLSEPEERLAQYRADLKDALAPNGGLVLEIVPEIESIIGPQPQPPPANPVEEHNRFQATMLAFLTTLTRRQKPLVVFLDDLQWSDAPTISLLEAFLADRSVDSLLFIGAFRKAEVGPSHPLRRLLTSLERSAGSVTIDLAPLGRGAVDQLVADALAMPAEQVKALAAALFERTEGNPLAVRELLGLAYREGTLWFDAHGGQWRWDEDRLRSAGAAEDLVTLLLGRLRQLPAPTQHWLQLAACLGASFDLRTLALVGETSAGLAALGLWDAIREGLILPIGDDYRLVSGEDAATLDTATFDVRYRFRHDRIQQAAYTLREDGERRLLHVRLGRLLREKLPRSEQEERVIEIARHLNMGPSLAEDDPERAALARLNLEAAQRARASAAYATASELLEAARANLPARAWQS